MARYFRNACCSEYDICLDFAAKRNLLLDCSGCPRRNESVTTIADLIGCKALLVRIFKPQVFLAADDRAHKLEYKKILDTLHDLETCGPIIPVWSD